MKKQEDPQKIYPEFWSNISPDNIPNKIYRKGTTIINTAITRRDWFYNTPFFINVKNNTSFLPDDCDFSERLYCYKNKLNSIPKCPVTNADLKWNRAKRCYNIGANASACAIVSASKKDKDQVSRSLLQKYSDIRENLNNKFKNGDYTLLSINTLKGYIDTFVDLKNKKFRKIYNSNLINDINELCSIMHYTDRYTDKLNTKSIWSARMYIIYYDKFNELDQLIDTYGSIPGYINFFQGFGIKPVIDKDIKVTNKILWEKIIKDQGFSILNENYLNDPVHRHTHLKCSKCGEEFYRNLSSGLYTNIFCPGCNYDPNISRTEKDLREEVAKIYNGEIIYNDRSVLNGKELDIYIPDKKIAIELNGVLWHSYGTTWPNNANEEKHGKSKHYRKYKACEKKGIQLLQFTDLEYNHKKDIVLSIIKSKLGLYDTRIYARKCSVHLVSKTAKTVFCDAYHLQGDAPSQIEYGLYHEKELVAVMTFGKRKITKEDPTTEIIRFCCKNGYNIVGGASKLLKYFINNHDFDVLKTYSDNTISNGKVYKELGFEYKGETKWNYWYFAHGKEKLYHRSNFMKHKLNTALTEKEEMYRRKYRRYYDAGNKVFEYKKEMR